MAGESDTMKTEVMTAKEVRTRGFQVLERELGPGGMLKFMHQFDEGRGDYSKDRHKIIDNLNIREVIKTIRQMQKAK
jgi:hypothetical protein